MVINQYGTPIPHDIFDAYMGQEFEDRSDDIEDILSELHKERILDWNGKEIFRSS